jgi:hypothetical protein
MNDVCSDAQVAVERNDVLDAGDLVVYIDTTAPAPNTASDPMASFESDSEGDDSIDQKAALAAGASNAN